ncbi:MAG: hemerythrin domain-containing protein [Firmicutes bacterium]|nr:hemerythrin domain-containing protein [Bacillota bacterium]
MKSSDILRNEHIIIQRFLNILEKALFRFERDSRQPPGFFEFSSAFIRDYIEKFHHSKEEEVLFSALEKACDYREDLPIEELVHDHHLGRDYTKKALMAVEQYNRGDNQKKREILDYFRLYIQHIRYHSKREDRVLYPMSDRLFDAKMDAKILSAYKAQDKENTSMTSYFEKVIETYENMPGF